MNRERRRADYLEAPIRRDAEAGNGDFMMYEFIEVERENALTIITINRPGAHNALNAAARLGRRPGFDVEDASESITCIATRACLLGAADSSSVWCGNARSRPSHGLMVD